MTEAKREGISAKELYNTILQLCETLDAAATADSEFFVHDNPDLPPRDDRDAYLKQLMASQAEEVRRLLKAKASLADNDELNGATALSLAISKQHYPIIKVLLDGKADIEQSISISNPHPSITSTPLGIAACTKDIILVDLLLEAKANPNPDSRGVEDLEPPLFSAVLGRSLEIVKRIVEAKADIHAKFGGCNIVSEAVFKDKEFLNPEIVEYLVKANAEVNTHNEHHRNTTPLMMVILGHEGVTRSLPIVRTLLDAKADIHAVDIDGETAMDYLKQAQKEDPERVPAEMVTLLEQYYRAEAKLSRKRKCESPTPMLSPSASGGESSLGKKPKSSTPTQFWHAGRTQPRDSGAEPSSTITSQPALPPRL